MRGSAASGTEGSASFWVGPMGRTGRGRGFGMIFGFNSTIVRGFAFFFTIGAATISSDRFIGRVLRFLLYPCVLLAVPPHNAIRVFWRRFVVLWKSVASILGLREPTPVMMSLAGSLSMHVCLPPEPKATVGHACTCIVKYACSQMRVCIKVQMHSYIAIYRKVLHACSRCASICACVPRNDPPIHAYAST